MVNLERRNLGELSLELVPEPVELLTLDLSYLSLAEAIPQLGTTPVRTASEADRAS